jgi:branched-chain amino acid transport system substrate-binding protein
MSKTTKIIGQIVILIIIIVLVIVFSKEKPLEGEVKIGVILPLTGELANYGNSWKRGIELGLEKIKRDEGIDVKVIYEDSQMDPAKAVTAAQKLINIDSVRAIIIGSSRETLAVAPIVEKNKILLMTSGNAAEITNSGDYVFRIYPSNTYQGNDLANIAIKKGYTKKLAVLTMLDDYGIGLSNIFKEKIEQAGGQVVVETFPKEGATDFKTQLIKIKTTSPEALLIIGAENIYPLILKQIKQLDLNIPLLATETFQSQAVLDGVGQLAEGVLYANFVEAKTKEYSDFVKAHKEKYNEEPGPFSTGFYDNTVLILESLIKNNGNIEKAKKWLYDLKGWAGATGITTYDKNGDPVGKSYTIMTAKNGQFVPYEE